MSFIFLQERGEKYSAECYSDIPVFALSRLSLTAEAFRAKTSAQPEKARVSKASEAAYANQKTKGRCKMNICFLS